MKVEPLAIDVGLHRVTNEIDRDTSRLVSGYGLTLPQFGVLEALYHKGPMTVGEVQEAVLSTCGTISVILKNLEKQGLIARRKDERDQRKTCLSLTPDGQKLIQELYPKDKQLIQEEFSAYTDEEQKELFRLLYKFRAASKKGN